MKIVMALLAVGLAVLAGLGGWSAVSWALYALAVTAIVTGIVQGITLGRRKYAKGPQEEEDSKGNQDIQVRRT